MSNSRLCVFISSSPGELTDERDAASAAVRTLRLRPVMHELGEQRQADARCDVFVGLYWQRYGWKSDVSAASAVEDEYLGGGDVPRLVYVKEPASERDPELDRLLEQIRSRDRISWRTFATPGELAELLLDDLAELMSQRFYGGRTRLHDLPEGTVSLLFADIDGSTPIVRLLGAAYPPGVLDPYRAVVAAAVGGNGGAVVDYDGDSDRATGPRESRSGRASAFTPETRRGRLTDTRASRFTARPGSARRPTEARSSSRAQRPTCSRARTASRRSTSAPTR